MRMQNHERLRNADVRAQQITERIRILAESILDNKRYAGQESKRCLCREVSIAIFTEMVRSLAATKPDQRDEWMYQGEKEDQRAQRLQVSYQYNSLLDTAEALDILDRMEGEEKTAWEDLMQETECAASWIRRTQEQEEEGPLLVTKQLMASQLIEESEWLQRRAIEGKMKSRDLTEITVLREHQITVQTTTERYGRILWKNGGYIPEALRDLAKAIKVTNRQMIETIKRARRKACQSKLQGRGQMLPPCCDAKGRTRSARYQAERMPDEEQTQNVGTSDSPATGQEDDVQEQTEEQDVIKRIKQTKRIK